MTKHSVVFRVLTLALATATFRDASCGAATTEHFTTSQSVLLGTNKPQFSRLTGTTDLVTVGIGGNDVGIVAAGLDCLGLVPLEPITDIGAGLPPTGCRSMGSPWASPRIRTPREPRHRHVR